MPTYGLMPRNTGTSPGPVVQTGRTYEDRPMIRRVSNEEMELKARQESEAQFSEQQNKPVISSLASHIRSALTAAISAKQTITKRLLACLRQREGIYEADIQSLVKQQNGTNIYMMITDIKCRALESWLKDIMLPSGERPYSIEPTPVPDIPPGLIRKAQQAFMADYAEGIAQQNGGVFDPRMIDPEDLKAQAEEFQNELLKQIREMAQDDADSLEDQIDDELVEGKWYEALSELIEDFATYPTAFLEGPIFRKRAGLSWVPVEGTIQSQVTVADTIRKEYSVLSPFDVYPSPGAKTIQDGDLCIRKQYTRRDLVSFKGVDGFDSAAIDQVLERYGDGGYREFIAYDTEISDLMDRPNEQSDPEGHIDCIKFFGSVQGFQLRQWGMNIDEIPDPFQEYSVIAYLVGSYVVGARLNHHPLGKRHIYSASFRHKNGSIWGKALPECMKDIQSICNSSARAICNNAAIASGPQIWQLVDLIPPEEDRTNIYPWKIWSFSSEKLKGSARDPMGFHQPTLIVNELLAIYKYFFEQASEVTGIPAYVYGNQNVAGAGKTASGLSMLMNAAAKGLRNAAGNIDKGVISFSVEEHWLITMLMRPDLAKGDSRIVARASEYLIQQEQLQIRLSEALTATNNPTDMEIIGLDGRSEMLRNYFKGLKMNPDKIVPDREDMIMAKVQTEVQKVVMMLAQALQMDPNALMQILQQGAGNEGNGQGQKPRELDAAGNPVSGQDVRMFNQ
uniref:Putative portal protein n=1 Tax=viral metagenome TaxID=1070528 RepID=A0A6H1ZVF3_9ZZZZ